MMIQMKREIMLSGSKLQKLFMKKITKLTDAEIPFTLYPMSEIIYPS